MEVCRPVLVILQQTKDKQEQASNRELVHFYVFASRFCDTIPQIATIFYCLFLTTTIREVSIFIPHTYL